MSNHSIAEARARVLALITSAFKADCVADGCARLLPELVSLAGAAGGFLAASDPRFPSEHIETVGLSDPASNAVDAACWAWLDELAATDALLLPESPSRPLRVYAVRSDGRLLGMIGLEGVENQGGEADDRLWTSILSSVGQFLDCLAEKASLKRRLLHFNTFQEVSSLLARSLGLSESLELALFSSMKAVSAEAASILLLNEVKSEFRFFHVEGAAKPQLGERRFSTHDGIAGRVLRTQEAEVVNNVSSDSQFYGRIDAETGFQTRNLIAVPLIAGNERIGVLEVLNRSGDTPFTAEDRLLLISVADHIAYAIRNAEVFDRAVSAYCGRRSGADSCEACPQPLVAWGPCVEYRSRGT